MSLQLLEKTVHLDLEPTGVIEPDLVLSAADGRSIFMSDQERRQVLDLIQVYEGRVHGESDSSVRLTVAEGAPDWLHPDRQRPDLPGPHLRVHGARRARPLAGV